MIRLTLLFFALMTLAGVLGFGGLTTVAIGLAKILFVLFTIVFLICCGSCVVVSRKSNAHKQQQMA